MKLYLAEHGKAVSVAENLRCPLSLQGRQDITHIAGFLSLFWQPQPQQIWHSNRLAAIETAAMIADAWQVHSLQQQSVLAPDAPLDDLLKALWGFSQDCLLVGHRDSLQALLGRLLKSHDSVVALTAGGMVMLQGDVGEHTAWSLQWALTPSLFYRS